MRQASTASKPAKSFNPNREQNRRLKKETPPQETYEGGLMEPKLALWIEPDTLGFFLISPMPACKQEPHLCE